LKDSQPAASSIPFRKHSYKKKRFNAATAPIRKQGTELPRRNIAEYYNVSLCKRFNMLVLA